jgi:mono/diheme cytochrome c family protein
MTLKAQQVEANPAEFRELSSPRGSRVPVLLVVLMGLLLYWGALYFDTHGAWFNPMVYAPYRSEADLLAYQPRSEGPDLARGKMLFDNICALCHGTDGLGKPGQAPPLAGSEWALGNPDHMIRIPLFGLAGPITVKGQDFNLAMPAMGATLSTDDLAGVLTYIRSSWGNKASPITPEQVEAIKSKVGNRTQPFTAAELNSL